MVLQLSKVWSSRCWTTSMPLATGPLKALKELETEPHEKIKSQIHPMTPAIRTPQEEEAHPQQRRFCDAESQVFCCACWARNHGRVQFCTDPTCALRSCKEGNKRCEESEALSSWCWCHFVPAHNRHPVCRGWQRDKAPPTCKVLAGPEGPRSVFSKGW